MQNELVMQLLVINSLVYLLFNSSIIIIIKLKVKVQQINYCNTIFQTGSDQVITRS